MAFLGVSCITNRKEGPITDDDLVIQIYTPLKTLLRWSISDLRDEMFSGFEVFSRKSWLLHFGLFFTQYITASHLRSHIAT